MNSYANPANERAALAAIRDSGRMIRHGFARMLPEIREFERSSTDRAQRLAAACRGVLSRHPGRARGAKLSRRAPHRSVQRRHDVDAAARKLPARTALPVPPPADRGRRHRQATGFHDVITCDIGGTSFDVSLVAGDISLAAQSTLDFGLVVRTPMIEITTIGAGGGSIASVDRGGLLHVGPQSAGSMPRPVATARAIPPTLTDAKVVLGRINARSARGKLSRSMSKRPTRHRAHRRPARPRRHGGGRGDPAGRRRPHGRRDPARLDRARARSVEFHPDAVRRRRRAACRALDPPDRTEMRPGAALPRVTSALGCVLADLRHDMVQTLNLMLDGLDAAALERRMRAAGQEASAVIAAVGDRGRTDRRSVRTGYALFGANPHRGRAAAGHLGQTTSEFPKAWSKPPLKRPTLARSVGCFPALPTRIVSLRVAAIGRRSVFDFGVFAPQPSASVENGAARIAAGLVRRRMARHRGVGAPRTSRRCKNRRAGHPGAAGHHHRDRTGPRRPDRPTRQSDCGAGLMGRFG